MSAFVGKAGLGPLAEYCRFQRGYRIKMKALSAFN